MTAPADLIRSAAARSNLNADTSAVVAGAADTIDGSHSVGSNLDRARSVALAYLAGYSEGALDVSRLSELAVALRVIDRALR